MNNRLPTEAHDAAVLRQHEADTAPRRALLCQDLHATGVTSLLAALIEAIRNPSLTGHYPGLDAAAAVFAAHYSVGQEVRVTDGAAECREALRYLSEAVDAYLAGDADRDDLRPAAEKAREVLP